MSSYTWVPRVRYVITLGFTRQLSFSAAKCVMALLMYAEMCSLDNESEELVKIRIPGKKKQTSDLLRFPFRLHYHLNFISTVLLFLLSNLSFSCNESFFVFKMLARIGRIAVLIGQNT